MSLQRRWQRVRGVGKLEATENLLETVAGGEGTVAVSVCDCYTLQYTIESKRWYQSQHGALEACDEDILSVVDEIYHDIEDLDKATVGDFRQHVAKKFGWKKCSEPIRNLIKQRLTDLVNEGKRLNFQSHFRSHLFGL